MAGTNDFRSVTPVKTLSIIYLIIEYYWFNSCNPSLSNTAMFTSLESK